MNNRPNFISHRCRVAGVLLAILALSATSAFANELTSIQATPLGGGRVKLDLTLSKTAPEPRSFTIDNPARIAIDLPNTEPQLNKRHQPVHIGAVNNIRTAAAGGLTRVVVDLTSMMPYKTHVSGKHIYITLGESSKQSATTFGPSSGHDKSVQAKSTRVTAIDFRRGDDNAGRVLVRLSNTHAQANVQKRGEKVIVSLQNTTLPKKLMQRLDVRDFATPVQNIDALRRDGNTRLVIHAKGQYKQLAYQSNDLLAIEIKPLTKAEKSAAKKNKFSGKRLTLNFQNISVRAVLQILADFSGLNMVVSDSVGGNITLRLQNVPWDQALHIILKTKGLAMRRKNNVVLIAPAKEMAAHEKMQLQSQQQIQKLVPLETTFIQINYAKASNLSALIKSQGNSMLSDRGSVTVDNRTNTLLVQDTAKHIANIRKLVQRLDVPIRQVLIESRIVIVNKDFTRDLGVRFGGSVVHPKNNGLVSVSGNATGAQNFANSFLNATAPNNAITSGNVPSVNNNLMVNAPKVSPVGQLAVAILNSNYLVDLELSALQAEGHGQIISRPHVITSNQHEALIKQGIEIPYQQASSSGATNVQFKDAVLKLKVTPQITPDDNIIMDLDVSKDNQGSDVASATGGSIPSIETREVKTQVLVANGDTVVLGGIYETKQRISVNKVPLLGDIPLLGFLFRNKTKEHHKKEMLIFVTPKIIKSGAHIDKAHF